MLQFIAKLMNRFSYSITTYFIPGNKDYHSYCNPHSVYQMYPSGMQVSLRISNLTTLSIIIVARLQQSLQAMFASIDLKLSESVRARLEDFLDAECLVGDIYTCIERIEKGNRCTNMISFMLVQNKSKNTQNRTQQS